MKNKRLGSAGSDLQTEPSLIAIAERHSCDPAAVMLAWGLQSGHSVIPKVIFHQFYSLD